MSLENLEDESLLNNDHTLLSPPLPPSRIEEIKQMWIENLLVPNDLTAQEIGQFWREMDYPHSERVKTVKKSAKVHNIRTLIETGTYEGQMIDACLDHFDRIISIEVNYDMYSKAKDKFAKHSHVTIVHGDSGEILPQILESINEPCLFWLDGHYVSLAPQFSRGTLDTPIWKELKTILNHSVQEHVVLIDDARCFIGPNAVSSDYPTIHELREFVQKYPNLIFEVQQQFSDIIHIYPHD